jgi:hypothetical protein
MYVDIGRTYLGVVENNEDPERLGRCRIRVVDIFDEIPTEDIPWATPKKDVNGNSFNIPDLGKFVTVKFDSGNIYKPEYYYSDVYNENLQKKLKSISSKSYTSMKAVVFDEKTQIFSNDEEGLIFDYKYNALHIDDSKIELLLKDNFGKINLGDAKADQQFVLGTNFIEWFTEFVGCLSGEREPSYHGNYGGPVIPSPQLIELSKKYMLLKDNVFLSHNVFVNSNFKISSVLDRSSSRPNSATRGDSYQSSAQFSNYQQTSTTESQTYTPTEIRPSDSTTKLDTQGSQNIDNGKLVVSDDKTSPTLIVFGGIDVRGRSSGEYMWDYFGGLKNKFNIFVAKNDKVDGIESYNSAIKYLSSNGYNTSQQILYLFSGGYLPGMGVLKNFADKFNKILLVDIWMGNDNVGNYYTTFVQQNKSKIYYIYTTFGANNKEASNKIAQTAGYAKLKSGGSNDDHMNCNKLAIDVLSPPAKTTPIPTGQTIPTNQIVDLSMPISSGDGVDYSYVNVIDGIAGSKPSIDFKNNTINNALLADIAVAAKAAGIIVTITTAITGHKPTQNHVSGNAVDIAIVNGKGYNSIEDAKRKGIYDGMAGFVEALNSMGYQVNSERGQEKSILWFGFPAHNNHMHISRKSGRDLVTTNNIKLTTA